MEKEPVYTSDGKFSVFCNGVEIARSYVGDDGYEVRVLQGVDREKVWEKIFVDCPEFASNNDMRRNYWPKLFPAPSGKRRKKLTILLNGEKITL
jgi:hypothetical protein